LSLQDQQLLAEEQDLAVLVTQEQAGHQRIDGRKEQQVEVIQHGCEGRRDRDGGQDGMRKGTLAERILTFLFPAQTNFGPRRGQIGVRVA